MPNIRLVLRSPRLVVDLLKAEQMGFFWASPAKPKPKRKPKVAKVATPAPVRRPPGAGWHPVGAHGGFRRLVNRAGGRRYEYWYPDTGLSRRPSHGDRQPVRAQQRGSVGGPRLVVSAKPDRSEAVTDAMGVKLTKGQRKSHNDLAAEIVARAASAERGLTDKEAVLVATYTGTGGISGDLNQFYTRTDIAQAMWDVTAAYQDNITTALEPSCGSGVFLATAPKGCKVTGVELDATAASVAEALHGHKHSVESKAFEEFSIERSGQVQDFDVVIANPPYCTRTGEIPLHKPEFRSADQYFIDTSLDHVKDGGLCTMLIHPGVLNNKSPGWQDFRARLLARAEVVDGFRLPDDCFKHVHCQISADILVLRKRDKLVGGALAAAQKREGQLEAIMGNLGAWDQKFVDGEFFADHPDHILGTALTAEDTGWRATVEGDSDKVPGELRKLTEKTIAAGGGSGAVTRDRLIKMSESAGSSIPDYLAAAKSSIAKYEAVPVIGNVQIFAGSRYLYIGEPPKWTLMETVDDVTQIIENSGDEAIRLAHDIALDIKELIRARDAGEYYKSRNLRRLAADRVKAWVEINGIPGSHRALGELSRSAPGLLDFIACVDANGQLSDILSKDAAVVVKAAEVDKADLFSVAAYVARKNRGYVNADDIQHNWEGWESDDEARSALLASGDYCLDADAAANSGDAAPLQHVEDYLTGNLYEKLDSEMVRLALSEDPETRLQLEKQIALLKTRIETKWRSIDDVPIQLRVMDWMGLEYFSAFLNSDEGRKIIHYAPHEPGKPIFKLVLDQGIYELQKVAPEGYERDVRTKEGVLKTVKSEEGTILGRSSDETHWLKYINRLSLGPKSKDHAKDVEEHIQAKFGEWLKSSEHRVEVEALYNRTFNCDFRRDYSGDDLGLEGMSPGIIPHDFQNKAVRWAAETGRGILAQDVGLGKTFIAILLAKLRKQNGQARRPFVVVPKSVATNWAEEIETLFPGSRVLVIGEHRTQTRATKSKAKKAGLALGLEGEALDAFIEKNSWKAVSDDPLERNRKLAMVKQNEYDLIVCTKPAFDRIPLKDATIDAYEKEDFWYQRAGKVDKIKSSKTQQTADKNIEKMKAAWAAQKASEKFKHAEDMVYWEDMGIDCLIADEAHAYKNLYAARTRFSQPVKFLGGSAQSKQARKMQHMSHVVRDANPANGVYFLTATPTKNSPLEVFNMLQHISPEAFHRLGIKNSEDFIDRFCKLEERLVLTPPGKNAEQKKEAKAIAAKRRRDGDEEESSDYAEEFEGAGNMESAQCVTGFTNLKELEGVMDGFMLIQNAKEVGLRIPAANDHTHLVDMTLEQKRVYSQLRDEASSLKKEEDPGGMFRILDQMKKAAQDLELLDPESYAGWYTQSPKYRACVERAYEGATQRGGQIIFVDHNKAHERVKAMLVEKGLKPEEIGIINAGVAADSEARQKIGNMFNNGTIKVVIGNTGTMGEGVNLQGKRAPKGTTDIHHLDQPWDPGTMHQRNGRGVRQGNPADAVGVHTYLAKGSFDGFRHSTLMGKQRWLDKLRSGVNDISNDMEGQGVDELEMLAMLSDDPDGAVAALKERKAAAHTAWYARQAAESVDAFYKWQRKIETIARFRGGDEPRQRLEAEAARMKRGLERNELLPLEVKSYLKAGDTSPVAVSTYLVGEGETSRLAAALVKTGAVIVAREHKPKFREQYRKVVDSVNLVDQTVKVRSWGAAPEEYSTNTIKIADLQSYAATEYKALDELKESLAESLESSYSKPAAKVGFMAPDLLEANRSMIDDAMRAWYARYPHASNELLVRENGQIMVTNGEHLKPEQEFVYPWSPKDRADIIRTIAAGNPRSDSWYTYGNDALDAANSAMGSYRGYSGQYKATPLGELVKEAELAWKRQRKQAA